MSPVLVIRTDGIGDAVLFEPALETLAQTMSPRAIHLWAPSTTLDLMRAVPVIDRRFAIPRGFKHGNLGYFRSPWWRVRIGFRMGMCVYDKVVYPADSPEPLGNWLFASVRARERWLNYGDTENQFEWQRQRAREKASFVIDKRPGSAHELLRNAYLATQWSGKLKVRKPRIHLTDAARAHAQRQLDQWSSKRRAAGALELLAVLMPAPTRAIDYPMGHWMTALKLLWQQRQALAVLIGRPEDARQIERLSVGLYHTDVPFIRPSGRMSLLETAALLARMDGALALDCGLAHVAVAQRVPTVVLVGGGHPGRFFPWPRAGHHVALNVRQSCEGCRNRCIQREPLCLTQISPEEIAMAYVNLRSDRTGASTAPTWTSPLQATG